VLDETLDRTSALVNAAFDRESAWNDGVRGALAAVLAFFDSEPALARAFVVGALAGGPLVLEQRERVVGAFRALVVSRLESSGGAPHASPLAAEAVVASVMGVIHARMVAKEEGPLVELLGPLMGVIVGPYLDKEQVEREIGRSDELARRIAAGEYPWAPAAAIGRDTGLDTGQGEALPASLGNARSRRARECLLFLAEHPDSSNREVAVGVDIAHQSHISRLLASLLHENLVTRHSEGAGKRNAWRLTPHGEKVAKALSPRRRPFSAVPTSVHTTHGRRFR
jgi:hypothetical protein